MVPSTSTSSPDSAPFDNTLFYHLVEKKESDDMKLEKDLYSYPWKNAYENNGS